MIRTVEQYLASLRDGRVIPPLLRIHLKTQREEKTGVDFLLVKKEWMSSLDC